jgi:protein gp37
MSDKTHIQWTDATWNVVTGCSKVGLGCAHCYAERHWPRLSGNKATKYHGRKFSDVRCHPEELDTPLRWKKPRRIFVPSMGDLFHPSVPEVFVAAVFGVMASCPQHTFLVLTKRPTRLQYWVKFIDKMATSALSLFPNDPLTWRRAHCLYAAAVNHGVMPSRTAGQIEEQGWPLPNVWLGVSCEDQTTADERIPILLDTPAAHRFVSAEPLLSGVDFSPFLPYSPVHETTTGRVRVQGREVWRVGDRSRGKDLASPETRVEPLGKKHGDKAMSEGTSGKRRGRLFDDPIHVEPKEVLYGSPSPRVPTLQGSDTDGAYGESQQRPKEGQPPIQPVVGNVFGTADACSSRTEDGANRSERGKERNGEIDNGQCIGNPSTPGDGREAQDDSKRLRGNGSRSVEDRPRPTLDFVIVGGESGPKARPCELAWIRSIVEHCEEAGIPVFVKQLGADARDIGDGIYRSLSGAGSDPSEWPEDLRVRENPE